eukprot:651170-Prorocentrum_minimum.AAC.1
MASGGGHPLRHLLRISYVYITHILRIVHPPAVPWRMASGGSHPLTRLLRISYAYLTQCSSSCCTLAAGDWGRRSFWSGSTEWPSPPRPLAPSISPTASSRSACTAGEPSCSTSPRARWDLSAASTEYAPVYCLCRLSTHLSTASVDLTSARIPTGEHGHARAGAVDKDLAREEPGDGEARLHQQTEYALVYCFCSLNVQAVLTTAESDLKVLDDNLEFLSEAASNLFQARRPPSLHNIT